VRRTLTRPSALTALVAGMLILLPVLAFLQYRWLGQLSDADRDRIERSLKVTTTAFVQQIDSELARAYVSLQLDAATVRQRAWAGYADRYAFWRAAANEPAFVTDVFLVVPDAARPEVLAISRWSVDRRTFNPTEWPADLAAVHARLDLEHADFEHNPERVFGRPGTVLTENGRTLVIPFSQLAPLPADGSARVEPAFGFTIAQLDLSVLERRIVPEAVVRHFGPHGADSYHLAIVSRDASERVVYESQAGDAAVLRTRADIDQPFFGLGPDQFPLLRQAATTMRTVQNPDGRDSRGSVFVGVFGRRNPSAADRPPPAGDGSRWRLLVGHRAGSLEAAVAQVRRRNLALSFGILVLMGISVGLIVIAARRAQRLARQQLEFVAGVSHELRTPVAVIGSAADNLAHGVVQDAARVKQYGATIGTEARRLGETVERVLEFAGIQSGVVRQPTAIAPVALVEQALAASSRLLNEAQATVETTYGPDVPDINGDPAALRAVVENLIANAVKYRGQHAWVHVSVSNGLAKRRGEVLIRVEDRGIGIPAAEQARIFEPFFRGSDALTRHIHGNGLGLSIVKRVVEAHGGRVSVVSTPGTGSTFTVHLPVLRQTEHEPATRDVQGRAVRADAR